MDPQESVIADQPVPDRPVSNQPDQDSIGLPTMADLDVLEGELDQIDQALAELDSESTLAPTLGQ